MQNLNTIYLTADRSFQRYRAKRNGIFISVGKQKDGFIQAFKLKNEFFK